MWRCESRSRVRQVADGLDEPGLFVVELIVVCAIREEIGEEFQQALFVHDEELLHLVGFVGVSGKDLKQNIVSTHEFLST